MCRLSWNALEFTALFLWGTNVLYNNNTWILGNMKLFLVLNKISHSFALLTREISLSKLEINFIFPTIHVLFSIESAVYCLGSGHYFTGWMILSGTKAWLYTLVLRKRTVNYYLLCDKCETSLISIGNALKSMSFLGAN